MFKRFEAAVIPFSSITVKKVLSSINVSDLDIFEENIKVNRVDTIKENIYRVSKEKNLNFGKLMQFLRLSLVGSLSGPDVFFIIKMIGKNVTLRRVNSLIEKIKKQ